MSEAATKPDIVVGVDGSDESFAALKWALEEASLTGQSVNAVFGWTHSWDMGSEPDSDEAWPRSATILPTSCVCGSTRPLQASTSIRRI